MCRKLYRDEGFQADHYLACYSKTKKDGKGALNNQQMECFRLLYEWRYNISKKEDKSIGYTLPNR